MLISFPVCADGLQEFWIDKAFRWSRIKRTSMLVDSEEIHINVSNLF